MKKRQKNAEKSDKELPTLTVKIYELLNGMPMGQALWLLKGNVPYCFATSTSLSRQTSDLSE
jgi:hypothetical protein